MDDKDMVPIIKAGIVLLIKIAMNTDNKEERDKALQSAIEGVDLIPL